MKVDAQRELMNSKYVYLFAADGTEKPSVYIV